MSLAVRPMTGRLGRDGTDGTLYLFIGQKPVGLLGPLENPVHDLVGDRPAASLQPVDDVRFAAHRADGDHLSAPEIPRRDARVDAIREPPVSLLERLDDRGGVAAGRA